MPAVLVTAATEYPVTLEETKVHLRVDHSEQDDLIELYIRGETQFAEVYMSRSLMPQTWDYFADAFPQTTAAVQTIELPMPKVTSLTGVFYMDPSGTEVELDAGSYVADLNSEPARIGLTAGGFWPTTYDAISSVRVRFTAGYQDGSSPAEPSVLADIKIGILLRVQATYDGGDKAQALRDAAKSYFNRHRARLVLA